MYQHMSCSCWGFALHSRASIPLGAATVASRSKACNSGFCSKACFNLHPALRLVVPAFHHSSKADAAGNMGSAKRPWRCKRSDPLFCPVTRPLLHPTPRALRPGNVGSARGHVASSVATRCFGLTASPNTSNLGSAKRSCHVKRCDPLLRLTPRAQRSSSVGI